MNFTGQDNFEDARVKNPRYEMLPRITGFQPVRGTSEIEESITVDILNNRAIAPFDSKRIVARIRR